MSRNIVLLSTVAAAVIGLQSLATPAQAAEAPRCAAPGQFISLNQALPRTAARIAEGGTLRIVAFGSSSTQGIGASSPANTYPSKLEADLRARFPKAEIVVVNRGVGGEDAKEMLARLNTVIVDKPDLVLWQVGTNAVVGNRKLGGQASLIRAGLARLKATGADLVLIDPQYAPKVISKSNALRMVGLLRTLARETGIAVFHRFSIMRHWRVAERLPFRQFITGDGLHMNDWSYECVAKLLGEAIVEAAMRPVPSASAAASRSRS